MAEQKTRPTDVKVEDFLGSVQDERQREDAFAILKAMKKITGLKPKMWGPSIIGFGEYHYKYESGHEGDCCMIGFSPRKGNLALYFMPGLHRFLPQLKKLGKFKTGKSCLYIKKLEDVDFDVLRDMIETAYLDMDAKAKPAKKTRKPSAP